MSLALLANDNKATAVDWLSKEEINALPLFQYSGEVVLVQNRADAKNAEKYLLSQKVLGFDTETKPSFRKGKTHKPSLVQLATHEAVFLFALQALPFGEEIIKTLEHEKIVKAGVAIHDDLAALQKLMPFAPQNTVDLGLVARPKTGCRSGLRSLAAHFLGVRISKAQQCSDWSKELSAKQICYAATDAWVSRELFLAMHKQGFMANALAG